MKPLMPDVIVNGETIPSAEIAAEVQNHAAPKGKPGLAWRAAARALVVRTLLLQAARAAHVQAQPQALDEHHMETEEDALIRAYLEQTLTPRTISDADCARAHAANPEHYRAPDLFMVSHILLAAHPDDDDARAKGRAAASEILARLQQNPDSFARLARESSDCPSGAQGGQLGQLGAGDTVPEFEAALKILAPGQIAPAPVETRYGVHVIRLDEFAPGRVLPFEAVQDRIREALEKAAWAQAARDLVAKLSETAEVSGVDMPAVGQAA